MLKHDGSVVPVETIVVGDLLMGPDSRPRRVVSLARGKEMMYRVTPVKGDSYIVNESHILSLKMTPKRNGHTHDLVNMEVREYLTQHNTFKHRAKGWRTGVDFPIRVNQHAMVIPAYHFGVWLGDGDSKGFGITTGDWEVVREFQGLAQQHGHAVRVDRNSPGSIRISMPNGYARGKSPTMNVLRSTKVLNNKHIPKCYLLSSRSERQELLAGLIDSDGHFANGYYDLIFKSERLANDVAFLARSLGLAAYIKPCQKTCTNNGAIGDYFRISISGHIDMVPCRVRRQKAAPRQQVKDALVHGIKLSPIGVDDYFGFELAGPDRLFLLGDFTVTHNTVIMTHAAVEHIGHQQQYPGVLGVAHRGALIGQMSNTFAKSGIPHDIVGSQALIRTIVSEHMENYGRTFYNPRSIVKVASVDTLPNRHDLRSFMSTVGLGLGDEGHHYLADNKWGRAYNLVNPHANWMLPTATPNRADGKGCGRDASGIVDDMVTGVSMQWLIDNGFLTNFRIRAPRVEDLDLEGVTTGASGDYNNEKLRKAVHKSTKIIGSVVDTYIKNTPGKLAICFAVDIEHAKKITAEFNANGVPAALLEGTMSEEERRPIMRQYKQGIIKVLVNVDLFGEGFDLPAVEVVIFARPTASYGLYAQMFGRALRLLLEKMYIDQWDNYTIEQRLHLIATSTKPVAYIHDHVGNIMHFQRLPTNEPEWSLEDRKGKRNGPSDAEPMRVCLGDFCQQPYNRFLPACPYCNLAPPPPAERSLPEHVDGDLLLYTPEMLMAMFGVASVDDAFKVKPNSFCAVPPGIEQPTKVAIMRRHEEKMREQQTLEQLMQIVLPPSKSIQENMRRFHHRYGVDVVAARLLGAKETAELNAKIRERLTVTH